MTRGHPYQDINGIYHFLDDFENGGANPPAYHVPSNNPSYYASQLTLESESSARAAPQSLYSDGGTSQTTNPPSIFSSNGGYAYTVSSTAPSLNGHERDFHQPAFAMPAPPPTPILPCEFNQYTQCPATFSPNDAAGWIDHVVNVHLNGRYPRRSMCWFCERKYDAKSDSWDERKKCFEKRMRHIARHWQEGDMTANMRPDFYFIDHIHAIGIIGRDDHAYLRQYSEVPRFPTFHERGYQPPQRDPMVPEVARSGQRRERRHASRRH